MKRRSTVFDEPYGGARRTLEEFASQHLDEASRETGQIETIAATTDNLHRAFCRLLGVMAAKLNLTNEEAYYIVTGNHYEGDNE